MRRAVELARKNDGRFAAGNSRTLSPHKPLSLGRARDDSDRRHVDPDDS